MIVYAEEIYSIIKRWDNADKQRRERERCRVKDLYERVSCIGNEEGMISKWEIQSDIKGLWPEIEFEEE